MRSGFGADQLRGDPDAARGAADAAFQNRGDAERFRDLTDIQLFPESSAWSEGQW